MRILLTGASGYVGQAFLKSEGQKYASTVVPKHEIIFPTDPLTRNWYSYVDIRDVVQALDLAPAGLKRQKSR